MLTLIVLGLAQLVSVKEIDYYLSFNETAYIELNEAFGGCKIDYPQNNSASCEVLPKNSTTIMINPLTQLKDLSNVLIFENDHYEQCFGFLYQERKLAFTTDLHRLNEAFSNNSIDLKNYIQAENLDCLDIYTGVDRLDFVLYCVSFAEKNNFYAVRIQNQFQCLAKNLVLGKTIFVYRLSISQPQSPENYEVRHHINFDEGSFYFLVIHIGKYKNNYDDGALFDLSQYGYDLYDRIQIDLSRSYYFTDMVFLTQDHTKIEFMVCFLYNGMCKYTIELPFQYVTYIAGCDQGQTMLKTEENSNYYGIIVYIPYQAHQIYPSSASIEVSLLSQQYITTFNYYNQQFYPSFKKKLELTKNQTEQLFYKYFFADDQYFYCQLNTSNNSYSILSIYEKTLNSPKYEIAKSDEEHLNLPFTFYSEQKHMSCKIDKRIVYLQLGSNHRLVDTPILNTSVLMVKSSDKSAEVDIQLSGGLNSSKHFYIKITNQTSTEIELIQSTAQLPVISVESQLYSNRPRNYVRGQGISITHSYNNKYCTSCIQLSNSISQELPSYENIPLSSNSFESIIFSQISNGEKYIAYQYSHNSTLIIVNDKNVTIPHEIATLYAFDVIEDMLNLIYQDEKKQTFYFYVGTFEQISSIHSIVIDFDWAHRYLQNINFSTFTIKHFSNPCYKNQFFLVTQLEKDLQTYSNYLLYTDLYVANVNCFQLNLTSELMTIDVTLLNFKTIFVATKLQIFFFYLPTNQPTASQCSSALNLFKIIISTPVDQEIDFRLINFPRFSSDKPPGIVVFSFGSQESIDFYLLRNLVDQSNTEHLSVPIQLIKLLGARQSLTELRNQPTFTLLLEGVEVRFRQTGALQWYRVIDQYIYIFSNDRINSSLTIISFDLLESSGNSLSYVTLEDSTKNLWLLPRQDTIINEYVKIKQPQKLLIELKGTFKNGQISWVNNSIRQFFSPYITIDQSLAKQQFFKINIMFHSITKQFQLSLTESVQFTLFDPQLTPSVAKQVLISNQHNHPIVDDSLYEGTLWTVGVETKSEKGAMIPLSKHIEVVEQLQFLHFKKDFEIVDKFLFYIDTFEIVVFNLTSNQILITYPTEFTMDCIAISEIDTRGSISIVTFIENVNRLYYYFYLIGNNTIKYIADWDTPAGLYKDMKKRPSNSIKVSRTTESGLITCAFCIKQTNKLWNDSTLHVQVAQRGILLSNWIGAMTLENVYYFDCNLISYVGNVIYFQNGNQGFYKYVLPDSKNRGETNSWYTKPECSLIPPSSIQYLNNTHFIEMRQKYFSILPFENCKERDFSNKNYLQFQYSSDCIQDSDFRKYILKGNQLIVPCFINQKLQLQYYQIPKTSNPQKQIFIREIFDVNESDIASYRIWHEEESDFLYLLILNSTNDSKLYQLKLNAVIMANLSDIERKAYPHSELCGYAYNNSSGTVTKQDSSCFSIDIDNQDYAMISSAFSVYGWILLTLVFILYAALFLSAFNFKKKKKKAIYIQDLMVLNY